MSGFTTRIELPGASRSDYARLSSEMIREGFSTTITANDGTVYELPPADYVYDYLPGEHVTREDVRDKAVRAASRVTRSFVVFVSVSVSWAWCGLREISPRAAR
jgi:hypothetical protein